MYEPVVEVLREFTVARGVGIFTVDGGPERGGDRLSDQLSGSSHAQPETVPKSFLVLTSTTALAEPVRFK